jgi:hypothetical protein
VQDELALAQERLGRTLERARASEDRELAGRVRDEGSQLVHQLNGLLRMCRLHSLENKAFEKPLRDLAKTLSSLIELLGTLTLALVEDQVYLNEIRIRLDEAQGGATELSSELLRHGLGGLRFYVPSSEQELRRFVACFAGKPDPQAPRAALRAALQREGLEGIELLGRFRIRATSGDSASGGGDALKRCSLAVIDSFDNLGRGRLFNPLPARRAVAELLASGREREDLAVDPPGCPVHVAHALRVCRLALLLGRELGLSHSLLQDLGVAALLHDVGYAETDRAGSGRAPDLERHPSAGARLLLRQRGFHLSKVRRVRAVLGHHTAATGRRRSPSLLSRLLRVVEDYDTLVHRASLAPSDALARMMSASGKAYDALSLQAFVNVLGACPPGSRVTLTDGRAGVVMAPGRGARGYARPVVMVDRKADGSALTSPVRVDVAESGLGLRGVPDAPPPPEPALPLVELPEITLVEPGSPLPPPAPAPAAKPPSAPAPLPALDREGPLSQGVPIRLIHDAHLESRSGRLTFESGAETCALHFVDGDVVAVFSSLPRHGLAALVAEGGLVPAPKLEEAVREAERTGHPLGRTLVRSGLMDAEFLEQVLAAQARILVANLVEWDEGRYRFVPDEGPQPEEDEGHSISTDALIVGAVRALHDPDVVRFALGDLGRAPRRGVARRGAEDILGPAERTLLEGVDGIASARALLKDAKLPKEQAERALLILLSLGLVDFSPDHS